MTDYFQIAREATSKVWDFDQKQLRPGATKSMIETAKRSVEQVDDELARDILNQALVMAEEQFSSQSNNTVSIPDASVADTPLAGDSAAMQAVRRVFDFESRTLRDNVTERQLQEAIAAVESMDRSDIEFGFLATAIGMAEREFYALSHQAEKVKRESGTGDAIDAMSLKDINARLAQIGFDDEREALEPDVPVRETMEDVEEDIEDIFEFDDDDSDDEKKEKKKKAKAEREAKAKANNERSKREYKEYEERARREREYKEKSDQLQADSEQVAATQQAVVSEPIPASNQDAYDMEREQLREQAERAKQEQMDANAQTTQRMQEAQHQRMTDVRDWENAKHGEGLEAVKLDTKSEQQKFAAHSDYEQPAAPAQEESAPSPYDIPASRSYDQPEYRPVDASSHAREVTYPIDAQPTGRPERSAEVDQRPTIQSGYEAVDHTHPVYEHSTEQQPSSYWPDPAPISSDENKHVNRFKSEPVYTQQQDEREHAATEHTGYSYGNSQNADSYFEQQKRQRMEDDLSATEAAQAATAQERIDQMVDEARERKASADAFSDERHSSMRKNDENVEIQHQTIHSAVNTDQEPPVYTAPADERTPQQSNEPNLRQHQSQGPGVRESSQNELRYDNIHDTRVQPDRQQEPDRLKYEPSYKSSSGTSYDAPKSDTAEVYKEGPSSQAKHSSEAYAATDTWQADVVTQASTSTRADESVDYTTKPKSREAMEDEPATRSYQGRADEYKPSYKSESSRTEPTDKKATHQPDSQTAPEAQARGAYAAEVGAFATAREPVASDIPKDSSPHVAHTDYKPDYKTEPGRVETGHKTTTPQSGRDVSHSASVDYKPDYRSEPSRTDNADKAAKPQFDRDASPASQEHGAYTNEPGSFTTAREQIVHDVPKEAGPHTVHADYKPDYRAGSRPEVSSQKPSGSQTGSNTKSSFKSPTGGSIPTQKSEPIDTSQTPNLRSDEPSIATKGSQYKSEPAVHDIHDVRPEPERNSDIRGGHTGNTLDKSESRSTASSYRPSYKPGQPHAGKSNEESQSAKGVAYKGSSTTEPRDHKVGVAEPSIASTVEAKTIGLDYVSQHGRQVGKTPLDHSQNERATSPAQREITHDRSEPQPCSNDGSVFTDQYKTNYRQGGQRTQPDKSADGTPPQKKTSDTSKQVSKAPHQFDKTTQGYDSFATERESGAGYAPTMRRQRGSLEKDESKSSSPTAQVPHTAANYRPDYKSGSTPATGSTAHRKRTPHHYVSDDYRPSGRVIGTAKDIKGSQPVVSKVDQSKVDSAAVGVVAGVVDGIRSSIPGSKRIPVEPETLTGNKAGAKTPNRLVDEIKNRYKSVSAPTASKDGTPPNAGSLGTVIGTGADIPQKGAVRIINAKSAASKVAGGAILASGTIASTVGLITNDQTKVIESGILLAGSAIGVASAGATSMVAGVLQKHQEVKARRLSIADEPSIQSKIDKDVIPNLADKPIANSKVKTTLRPEFGERTATFDKTTGKRVRIGKEESEKIIGKSKDKTELSQTPFERRMGMMYSKVTHTNFVSAVKHPLALTGKNIINVVANTDALRNTDVGHGIYKLRNGVQYAKGAVSVASMAGTLAHTTGLVAGNAREGLGAGFNYWRGKDTIGSAAIKKGAHFVPIRAKAATRQWTAFSKLNRDLVGKYTSNVAVSSGQILTGDLKRTALDVFKNSDGKTIYRVLNLRKLDADIKDLTERIGELSVEESQLLEKLKDLRAKGAGKIASRMNSAKIQTVKRNIANVARLFTMSLASSDNAAAKGTYLMVTSGRFVRAGIKVQLKTIRLGMRTKPAKYITRQAKKGASAAGSAAAKAASNAGSYAIQTADRGLSAALGMDYNKFRNAKRAYIDSIKKNMKHSLNGGIHNKVKSTVAQAGGKIASKVGDTAAGKAINAVGKQTGKAFSTFKKATDKVAGGVKKAADVVKKPFEFIATKIINPISIALNTVKMWVLIGVAIFTLILFIFVLVGTAFMSGQFMFTTDTNNLQHYINYAISVSEEWFEGNLEDSKHSIGGSNKSLNEVYSVSGSPTGRYRIVTTKYVDKDGNEIDSNDNIKEILSMVAVKTFNTWPEDWEMVDAPFDGDDWSVSSVQKIIKALYAASHAWESVEKGPYTYYKEVNNTRVRLLRNTAYPGSGYTYKTLKGDAEGEACQGPRDFKCTESHYDTYSSEYRKEMDASYGPRGGCTVDYSGYGVYNSAQDTLMLEGSLHDGMNIIYDAHSQVWANADIKTRYRKSQMHGGEGDESRIKHSRSYNSPASGCHDYTEHHEHTASKKNNPPDGCLNYRIETPEYTSVMQFPSSWPTTVTFNWNGTKSRYEYKVDGATWCLPDSYNSYPHSYITFYYRNNLNYTPSAGRDIYIPSGTMFYCNDVYYDCNEIEYYCEGHRERVTIYYCPGHQEYYCDNNHYDLDVNIHITHFDDDEMFYYDVTNPYDYKRKAKAVSNYPAGFNKMRETSRSDFYWDQENISSAVNLASMNWEELYNDIEGIDDVTMELNDDTIKKYREYLDVDHIASWSGGVPKDRNNVEITMHGESEWFYDETRGKYVKVQRTYTGYGRCIYSIIEESRTSPVQLSAIRRKVIETALSAVGKIPYQDGGAPGTGRTLADFGWVDDDRTKGVERGLSSGGFVAWVYQVAGKNITNTDNIKKIWDASTEIGDRNTITDDSLSPGDLGFINTYDDRQNDEVAQTEEDLIPYNTVGIYLGTNELGQRIWIQSSQTNETVSITTSNAFNYFRRVNGVS